MVSIQKVVKVESIPNSDKIELVTIQAWEVVVQKEEFTVGDDCWFIPIDYEINVSFEKFSHFVSKPSKDPFIKKWKKIDTKKIRSVVSQGLVFPINYFTEEELAEHVRKYKKDTDFETKSMDKTKGSKGTKEITNISNFPTGIISKTDETNVKSEPEAYEAKIIGQEVYLTLKVDGSSVTIIKDMDGKEKYCSRNLFIEKPWLVVPTMYAYDLKIHERLPNNIVLQGEICGKKINKNSLSLNDYEYYVFNIKNLLLNKYLNYNEMLEFSQQYDIKLVPLIKRVSDFNMTVKELQEFANTLTYMTNNRPAEGLVIRTIESQYETCFSPSFKMINQNYKD